jgi:hypothetical protein
VAPERQALVALLQVVLLQVAQLPVALLLRRAARVRRVAPEQELLLRRKVLVLLPGRAGLLVAPEARLLALAAQLAARAAQAGAVALTFKELLTAFLPLLWRN